MNQPLRKALPAELRATVVLALPLIASQLAVFGQQLVDVLLAGHLGPGVLGAVALGTNIWFLPLMAIVGLMMAVPPNVAQLDGAGRTGEVGALFRQVIWLAAGVGCALGVLTWFGGPALAGALGIEPALAADAASFLRAIALEAPALALFCACRGLTDGLSRTRIGLAFSLGGLVLLPPAAWALMYGRLGLPALGAAGAGYATAGVTWLQALLYLAYVLRPGWARRLGRGGGRRPDFVVIAALLRLGVPMSVATLLEVGMFSAVAMLVARFGALAIGSHQIALSVSSASFMVPLGLSMAITVRVGNAVGRGDRDATRRAGLAGVGLACATQCVACAVFLTSAGPIAGLYTDDPALRHGAASLLFLAALFQLSDGVQVAAGGALRGMKDTRVPMIVTALSYWGAGMPTGCFLAFALGMGLPGMWIGLIVGLTCAAALLLGRFLALTGARLAVHA